MGICAPGDWMAEDGNDGRAPDYSAVRANARLELHEAVCAERYAGILAALERAAVQSAVMHDRLNQVSSRMWIAVTSFCGAAVVGLAVMVFYLITRER
jgi:hypothetical protein